MYGKWLRSWRLPMVIKRQGQIVGGISRQALLGLSGAMLLAVLGVGSLLWPMERGTVPAETAAQNEGGEKTTAASVTPYATTVLAPLLPDGPRGLPQEALRPAAPVQPVFSAMPAEVLLDFGWQFNAVYQDWRYHTGIDVKAVGGEAVTAVCSGLVQEIFYDRQSGLTVVVKNGDYTAYYGALQETVVAQGENISAGQSVGTAGRCDGEPYLHWHLAIQQERQYINPRLVLTR